MSATLAKALTISHEMYNARDVVLALRGREKFAADVEERRPLLEAVQKARTTSLLGALIVLLKDMKAEGRPELEQIVMTAAAVEIIEPSLA